MESQKHYDYIITGGGCAGLSLVYYMLQSRLKHKKILIIEKDAKNRNDRTWCFWEKSSNPFEELVFHRWQHVYFHSSSFSSRLVLAPYTYKMIRSLDFYRYLEEYLAGYPNVEQLQVQVESITEEAGKTVVSAGGHVYTADWVFNSIRAADEGQQAGSYHYLLQHFKGWVIRTEQPLFNPDEAVLMDFRIEQSGDCRFMYVLPTDSHTALLEYTVFSEKLLPAEAYDAALQDYLHRFLNIDRYAITHEEFGVIPMTDMPYAACQGERIINIGTAGGITKPSTGYTFLRIQHDTQALLQSLLAEGKPLRAQAPWHKRFLWYDRALLHVLSARLHPADDVFTHLFANNPSERVFKFLDEETWLWEEIQLAASVPRRAFIQGMGYAFSRWFR